LLLDEPTAGLDSRSTAVFRDVLLDLSSSGKMIILATHDSELMKIATLELEVLLTGPDSVLCSFSSGLANSAYATDPVRVV
jgi:energy-coupling factor transporter ATP-binding protein EcfA2